MKYDINERVYQNAMILRERRRIVRRNKMILFSAAVFLFVFMIFSVRNFTFAKTTDSKPERVKMYKSITIYCGDSLTSLADAYRTEEWKDRQSYMHEVEMINHLKEDDILIAGNYLTIPYYAEVSSID